MSVKMSEQQVEALLRLTLIQQQTIAAQLKMIEADSALTPEEKLNLMAEILNPIQGIKE